MKKENIYGKIKGTPLISVVIPAHNEEEDIHESLGAIMGQSYKNLDIIVVNDGSTDRTKEIIESYMKKDKRIRILNFKTGHSCAFSCNQGIKIAKGDIILVNAADMIAEKDFVKKIVDGFRNYDIQGLAWRTRAYKPKTWISKAYAARRWLFPDHSMKEKKVYEGELPCLFVCWKADVIKKLGGFNTKIFYFEDADLAKRFMKAGYKVLFDPDIILGHKDPETLGPFIRQSKWISRGLKRLIKVYPKKAAKLITVHLLRTAMLFSPLLYLFTFLGFPMIGMIGLFGLAVLVGMIFAGTIYIGIKSGDFLYSFVFMLLNTLRSPVSVYYMLFDREKK
jgi:cellulose synthase/poly-beta-1,6-N-acetylglucosamine synthase-like glycosyltransferase